MAEYHPIDCGFYDLLEHHAIRGDTTEIVYRDVEGNQEMTVSTRILDVYARGGEEFVVLADPQGGAPIRLDRLVRVGNTERPGVCAM